MIRMVSFYNRCVNKSLLTEIMLDKSFLNVKMGTMKTFYRIGAFNPLSDPKPGRLDTGALGPPDQQAG
jgi:hypothetical protein